VVKQHVLLYVVEAVKCCFTTFQYSVHKALLHGCYSYFVEGTALRISYWLRGVSS
jgi:hypothetical protein